ncbi:MAG: hypothetical protein V7740_07915, partial [Pseudomonas marincola]
MINSVSSAASLYRSVSAAVTPATSAAQTQVPVKNGFGEAVSVALSPAAEGVQKLGSDFTRLTLDPAYHLQQAEVGLKDLIARLGIPENTDIQIEVQENGDISVDGDHPLMAQLAESLNGDAADPFLRSAFILARNGSIMSHIGAAADLAANGASESPGKADHYYDWVRSVAANAQSSTMSVSM